MLVSKGGVIYFSSLLLMSTALVNCDPSADGEANCSLLATMNIEKVN